MNGLLAVFTAVSMQYHLPLNLLASLCYVESTYNVDKIHRNDGNSDSYGVCQIKYETARQFGFKGNIKDLMKPENNVRYAAAYLNHQIHRYKSIEKGVIAYNLGHAGALTSTKYQRTVFNMWRKTCHE
jgi:soluble lytic murein transglycosylase-like protein